MQKMVRKVARYLQLIEASRYTEERPVGEITVCPSDYKTSNTPPPLSEFREYREGEVWGNGNDTHAWFHFEFHVPEEMRVKPVQLYVHSGTRGWDGDTPQFIIYINGVQRQGIDVNHPYVMLGDISHADVYVYGYTGPKIPSTRFFAKLRNVNTGAEQLFFDLTVPFEMLAFLNPDSGEYSEILTHLDHAVTMLDLDEVGSDEYFDSIEQARGYMASEFYGKYCSTERGEKAPTTVGIGHTHIDCAWKWTLKQTREKVQRSFATVLELMDRYPDYKFMSSQALLYQNLKEEAPKLYEQVKRRVAEGRWEVEGSMWVEADCNLSSGESLVRQILYGKRFFKEEFGVDTHILWLPDVFGYSAAMPQILRKSGVDWFVTSKISWNDTDTMPHDTFSWIGIDGTPINSYFLTAQDQSRSAPERHTTYVGNTGSAMIAGTWNRYKDKNLNNEAILTFGYGDGGGGPTAEMIERGRRAEKGIPGLPLYKMDFASDFLARVRKRIEDQPGLPTWRGELYLEFHRGTYTSMAKNKRNNRKSEFLYLDTELTASIAKALCGNEFPKSELHSGWEMLLTNQFHDIIPGSSIREVYEQSDKDYAKLMKTAEDINSAARTDIASRLDRRGGYVVFNPHSFRSGGAVEIDGVTALVGELPAKGYKLTDRFIKSNRVRINGKTVETNRFTVTFDDAWQIISIYDKANEREVLKKGKIGNELRIYADYPDQFDAWEWQEYSLDRYSTLKAVSSVEMIEDGARRGIRIVRPYRGSVVTQTIWFWDDLAKIDFDTVADWHQHHLMVKAAFPVDVNSDKATYEIQFGTIERPTHKNTSWDEAKFEVCAQKYADLSDGGYGVSLINDCKYGHDIHDGLMMLSLIKCATDPNEDADQGEIRFVYSLCPHNGRFDESETSKLAYYLNYPITAVKATGEKSLIPEAFSAVTLDRENVICETVKEAEDSKDIVLRLYESKNIRTKLTITTDLPFDKAYLCDLMENELCELPVSKRAIRLTLGGFEIVTVKLKSFKGEMRDEKTE